MGIFIISVLISSIGILVITGQRPKHLKVKITAEDFSDVWVNVYGEIIGLDLITE